jgi:hypothetical protein
MDVLHTKSILENIIEEANRSSSAIDKATNEAQKVWTRGRFDALYWTILMITKDPDIELDQQADDPILDYYNKWLLKYDV